MFMFILFICYTGRPWPLAFGSGVGIGMGLSNCQHDFMYPNLHHGHLKKVKLSYDYTHLQYTVVHENYDILLLVII